jgi:glucose-6-phosphate dehydrogenase assembly protein OpcA
VTTPDPPVRLLPDGAEMPFPEISAALAHRNDERAPLSRVLIATIVAVGPDDRLEEAAGALRTLGGHTGVRGILISVDSASRRLPRLAGDIVALSGLQPSFVNNAVAALRLSSLPTIVWWRGGRPDLLGDLTQLADRVVLEGEPREIWPQAAGLFDVAAFSDLRWTRLTRWRSLMANFFDIPEVRDAAPGFNRLRVVGTDDIAAALFADWLVGSLGRAEGIELEFTQSRRGAFIEAVRFGDQEQKLSMRLVPSGSCVMTSATVRGHRGATRTVPMVDQSLAALMTEELRVRARDRAFEAAVLAFIGRS